MATRNLIPRKSNTRPITPGSRITSSSRKENTPSKNPYTSSSKNTVGPRHRPSYSHSSAPSSLDAITDRIAQLLKDDFLKNPSKTTTENFSHNRNNPPKTSTPKGSDKKKAKSARHSRTSSLAERPSSLNTLKKLEPEKTHRRKFSLETNDSIPLISQVSFSTNKGYIPENPGKTNQDNHFEFTDFANHSDMHLFGVCDGHGFYGGEVSGFVKKRLPELLANDPNIYASPKKAIIASILRCNSELQDLEIDINFSGTTLIMVLIKGTTLFCANVGDSRALIARQVNDTSNTTASGRHWMSIVLSRDHKPDEKDESARILHCGGRIESYQDEHGNPLGPARVWLKHQDLPGLAMSRSLGDGVASSVGVICDPEILEFNMTPEDKFICLGSDGIFEFIPNEDIVKIVVPFWRLQDSDGACKALAKEAHNRWCKEEEVIDDITCICVFLNVLKA